MSRTKDRVMELEEMGYSMEEITNGTAEGDQIDHALDTVREFNLEQARREWELAHYSDTELLDELKRRLGRPEGTV